MISVIIPTYNEALNIQATLKRVVAVLDNMGQGYEILVVDDNSSDETASLASQILINKGAVINRRGKKSLALSVTDALKNIKGDIAVIMDADGSHPPELIPSLISALEDGCDLAIASRYVEGGSSLDSPLRIFISKTACLLSKVVTDVKDATSGFYCVKKSVLENLKVIPIGFKVGLEIFVRGSFKKYKEVPYTFTKRSAGESKFDIRATCDYLIQIFLLMGYRIETKILKRKP